MPRKYIRKRVPTYSKDDLGLALMYYLDRVENEEPTKITDVARLYNIPQQTLSDHVSRYRKRASMVSQIWGDSDLLGDGEFLGAVGECSESGDQVTSFGEIANAGCGGSSSEFSFTDYQEEAMPGVSYEAMPKAMAEISSEAMTEISSQASGNNRVTENDSPPQKILELSGKRRSTHSVRIGPLNKKRKSSNVAEKIKLLPNHRSIDEISSSDEEGHPTADTSQTNGNVNPELSTEYSSGQRGTERLDKGSMSTATFNILTERFDTIETSIATMQYKYDGMMKSYERMEKIMSENNRLLKDLVAHKCRKPAINLIQIRPDPAQTMEQLDEICQHPETMRLLLEIRESNLTRTLTQMCKVLMTRDLAMQFSLTGRGKEHVKMTFMDSPAYKLIEHAIFASEIFQDTSIQNMQRAFTNVFKYALDWEGNRDNRKRKEPSPPSAKAEEEFLASEYDDQDDADESLSFVEEKFIIES